MSAGFEVEVRLFGALRERAGSASVRVGLGPEARVADLLEAVRAAVSGAESDERPAVAVNRRYADPETPVRPGDEIALIPPVSGG